MMLALMLAQLVLPWPGLDSPLVQPGPTICVGACAGPVIYGAAEPRGRLVVACDMTSDTCSDGRRITTTRSTPVPCEVSPGVWEMVPENTACISWRGLESWAATTSYLAYGAELDRSPWEVIEGASIDGRILTGPVGSARLIQTGLSVSTGPHTLACRMRALSGNSVRLRVHADGGTGHSIAAKSVGPEWATVFHTWEIGGEPTSLSAHIYPDGSTLEIAGCWLTKTATPGRACWGGEAPVTCARDFHRMPATGFPATTGEISWVMSLERMPDGGSGLRGIVWADGAPIPNRISLTESGRIRVFTGETAYNTGPLSWEPGRSYTFRLIMAEDEWKVVRDGVLVGSTPPLGSMDWPATVRLGELLDGAISSLTVRSYEEVSP